MGGGHGSAQPSPWGMRGAGGGGVCAMRPPLPALPRAPDPQPRSSRPLPAASRGAPSPCAAPGRLCQAGRTPTRRPPSPSGPGEGELMA